jgi:hypothetical protein
MTPVGLKGRSTSALRIAALGLCCALTAQAQQFVEGDATKIAATAISTEPCGKGANGSLITIRAVNRGAKIAEPLVFEATPKGGATARLRRCPGPYVGRVGRGLAPGATRDYVLLHRGLFVDFAGAAVRVAECCFLEGVVVDAAPVVVGAVRRVKKTHETGKTVDFSVIPLKNRSTRPADVVLRVVYEEPVAAKTLFYCRLGPGKELEASLTDFVAEPPGEAIHEAEDQSVVVEFAAPRGARLASVAVADWVEIAAPGEGAGDAARLFREAYDPWVRWPRRDLPVSGAFRAVLRQAGASRRVAGTFVAPSADATPSIKTESPATDDDANRIRDAIGDAFEDLRRPSTEEAVVAAKPRLVRGGRPAFVAFDGEPWSGKYRRQLLAADGGRFVRLGFDTDPRGLRAEWICAPFEGGYVVAGRRHYETSTQSEPTTIEAWSYAREGALVAPATYSARKTFPAEESIELAFEGVREDGAAAAASRPVDSPAMRAARDAWNAGYRHPGAKVSFSGRLRVKAGKDLQWRGRKEVKGTFAVTGYSGGGWDACETTVEGEPDENVRSTFRFVIEDRLRMWRGRDYAAREAFEAAFAGAEFSERAGEPGVFDATQGRFRTLKVRDGRVVELTFAGGVKRTLHWSKVAGRDAVTKIVTQMYDGSAEECAAELAPMGEVLIPTRMNFKGVFGDEKEWGTEEIALADVKPR